MATWSSFPPRLDILPPAQQALWPLLGEVAGMGSVRYGGTLIGAALRDALLRAEPGWFSERSWGYWCYLLGITEPGDALPPMPARVFPDLAP